MNTSTLGQIDKELCDMREIVIHLRDSELAEWGQAQAIQKLVLISTDVNRLIENLKSKEES